MSATSTGLPGGGMPDPTAPEAVPGWPAGDYVLTLACPDVPGIVHAVSGFLLRHGGHIIESQQYGDRATGRFFMRIDFETSQPVAADILRADFEPLSRQFSMTFGLWEARAPYRTLILVSRHLHCLNDLLFRASTGQLQVEIPAVVSNHSDAEQECLAHGVPFHHVPVTPQTRRAAEATLLDLVEAHDVDLVVLARYMQVLSDEVCERLSGRAINIHHSFLPSFKGAKPYQQAYERGVKLVGATAHYVTPELDEGPIIEQDTVRVTHAYTAQQLASAGRDVEAQVLARAVRWHAESRVLLNGNRTVVLH